MASILNPDLILQRMVIINIDIPLMIIMAPNPQTFKAVDEKVFTLEQTLGGWISEHWGNKPEKISCSGITRTKYGTLKNNTKSHLLAEGSLLLLQQIYKWDKEKITSFWKLMKKDTFGRFNPKSIVSPLKNRDMLRLSRTYIWYKGTAYTGFFTNFNYEEKAEMPRNYSYSFEFMSLSNTTDLTATILINSLRNLFTGAYTQISSLII